MFYELTKISKRIAIDNNIIFIDTMHMTAKQIDKIDDIISELCELEYCTTNYTLYYNVDADIYVIYM